MKFSSVGVLIFAIGALSTHLATAKVTADLAAQLDGPKYTCIGSERAGDPANGIPDYSGKYQGTWPGLKTANGFDPGPYAGERALFSITAQNMNRFADKLTDGERGLFHKYPQAYRMDVYPTHRDFKDADIVCERTKKNAITSEVVHDGRGVTGTAGAIPFPFPQSGLEAVWNLANAERVWTQVAVCDIADVYRNSTIAWGRQKFKVLTLNNDPKATRSYQDRTAAHFYIGFMLPERDKGFIVVGSQPNDFTKEGTASWQYSPGLRRVRQAPEIGFDYPTPPAGLRTTDDDHGFNGSPERYNWRLVGKKEIYVPWDNFRVNDPAVKYKDLLKLSTINPDYMRYELRRVWVVEGSIKEGERHLYHRRVLYVDEDTWLAAAADNSDARGTLWRTALITYFFSQEGGAWLRGVSLYQDMLSGGYEAGYLTNESSEWWRVNTPMTPAQFTAAVAQQSGH
jgi:hypothetical protein